MRAKDTFLMEITTKLCPETSEKDALTRATIIQQSKFASRQTTAPDKNHLLHPKDVHFHAKTEEKCVHRRTLPHQKEKHTKPNFKRQEEGNCLARQSSRRKEAAAGNTAPHQALLLLQDIMQVKAAEAMFNKRNKIVHLLPAILATINIPDFHRSRLNNHRK